MPEKLHKTWKRIPKKIRQTVILVIGLSIVLIGITLLALPGPGWVVIFIGLALLGTEFENAHRLRIWIEKKFKQTLQKARESRKVKTLT